MVSSWQIVAVGLPCTGVGRGIPYNCSINETFKFPYVYNHIRISCQRQKRGFDPTVAGSRPLQTSVPLRPHLIRGTIDKPHRERHLAATFRNHSPLTNYQPQFLSSNLGKFLYLEIGTPALTGLPKQYNIPNMKIPLSAILPGQPSEACCTCATVLSEVPRYSPRTEKPYPADRRLECCPRVICGRCIHVSFLLSSL